MAEAGTGLKLLGDARRVGEVVELRAEAPAERAKLRVTAVSGEAGDAIEKPMAIHPDGRRREETRNAVVDAAGGLELTLPAGAMAGSWRAEVRVYPSVVARVLESMEALLERPWGCGEQTISSTYPNLLLLQTLKRMGAREARMEARALENLQRGYERLLGYQTSEGGFAYWHDGKPDVAVTVYALELLGEAREFVPVDEARVKQALEWVRKQAPPERGVSAMRLGALARVGAAFATVVERELGELARRADAMEDPYTIAAFALAALDAGKPELAGPAVERLRGLAEDEKGAAYWALKVNTPFHGWGSAARVETTARVVTALGRWSLAGGKAPWVEELMRRGALFLFSRADRRGIWASSQATARALAALAGTWTAGEAGPIGVEVQVDGEVAGRMALPAANSVGGVVTLDLTRWARPGAARRVKLAGLDGRVVQAQVNTVWFEPWSGPERARDFELETRFGTLTPKVGEAVRCEVKVSRPAFRGYGMMIAEIGLPPGAEVDRASLEAARDEDGSGVDAFEVAPDHVTLYTWPRAADSRVQFEFRPRYRMRARARESVLYDYYNPEARAVLVPEKFEVGATRGPEHGIIAPKR
jgi:uncharacterized protein YfaS (alpha-2-macroglobulin family)